MRITHILFALVAPILLLCSCGKDNIEPNSKEFKVDKAIRCTYHTQGVEIKFSMESTDVKASVNCNVDWVTEFATQSNKSITAKISENIGAERTATITLTAPGYKKATIHLTQNGAPTSVANHTLMYYFFGTSLGRYFTTNIDDAKLAIKSGALGENNRVIYFRQRNTNEAYIAEICFDKQRNVCYESIIEDNIAIDGNPISPEHISQTINKMVNYAPAERYGLILAGHGTAWIPRESTGISKAGVYTPLFVPNQNAEITRNFGESNVKVNASELAEGINNSEADIDYILFDACFMSNIETIYELRNSANYIIASPCEIMGRGFPYERTLPHLFKDNGASTDYTAAAESYYLYYRDEYASSSRCGSIAVYNCSEIEALKEATKEVVKSAKEEYDINALQTYEGQDPHYFYDFGEWVNTVATDNVALQNFNTQFDKAVIAKYTLDSFYSAYGTYGTYPINVEAYSGVTTSAPSEVLNAQWIETEWYKSVWQL